jgi:prepilin-type N-terminal cleavage/methylation domain-containing protein
MKRLHGYTLVEIAIVLLVLALLLGGLLKWQSVEDGQAQTPAAMPE